MKSFFTGVLESDMLVDAGAARATQGTPPACGCRERSLDGDCVTDRTNGSMGRLSQADAGHGFLFGMPGLFPVWTTNVSIGTFVVHAWMRRFFV